MKLFKQLFRSVVLVGFAGGWTLSAAALHFVRTPTNSFPVILTKDHLGFKDTYVDTRNWTISDDAAHPIVVARLIELGRADLLSHTVSPNSGPVAVQLSAVVQNQAPAQESPSLTDKAKEEIKNAEDAVMSKIN
jgi:hypothetical protein